MDGAPYLRKVDLRTYSTYRELSSALEKMFSCFTLGKIFLLFALGKYQAESFLVQEMCLPVFSMFDIDVVTTFSL